MLKERTLNRSPASKYGLFSMLFCRTGSEACRPWRRWANVIRASHAVVRGLARRADTWGRGVNILNHEAPHHKTTQHNRDVYVSVVFSRSENKAVDFHDV